MKNNDNHSLSDLLSPSDGAEAVSLFLRAANRALRGKSDADLAGVIGVPASTVANWKRRGVVAENGKAWFRDQFITALAMRSSQHLPTAELAAVEPFLAIIGAKGGNPLGVSRDAPYANAMAFGGMLAWSQFVIDALRIAAPPGPSFGSDQVRGLVEVGIARFSDAPPFQIFR